MIEYYFWNNLLQVLNKLYVSFNEFIVETNPKIFVLLIIIYIQCSLEYDT